MVRYLLFFFLPLSLLSQTLKIASYNVENLFDMRKSGFEYRDYTPGIHNWREPILVKKLQNLAEVICDLDADVIGLQEVENDHALARLQRVLKRVGCDYGYRAITDSKNTPIHNAVLSKIPIKKKKDILIRRTSRHRSILEIELKTSPPVRIFVNHWKSKSGPESKRIVYAKALVKRLRSLPKASEYIILGDFNSNYNEFKTIKPKHNDSNGVVGLNQILKTSIDAKLIRWHTLSNNDKYHYNLWMELPPHARWSHNFFGQKEGIDSIVIPSSLHNDKDWEYQKGSFAVFKPDYLFGKRGEVKRWEYKSQKHTGKGYSDHLPIYATFVTGIISNIVEDSVWDKLTSVFRSEKSDINLSEINFGKTETINPTISSIEDIIYGDNIEYPVILKNVQAIFKRRDTAIIKQKHKGRAILLYRCADVLDEGKIYDITVYKKKKYKGLDEILDLAVDKKIGIGDSRSFIKVFTNDMMQDSQYINEVVTSITGTLLKSKIKIDGEKFSIYFKKQAKRPVEGSRIKILIAQIGYYKNHMQLVVWDKNDYEIIE